MIKGRSKDISSLHYKTYGFTSKERNSKLCLFYLFFLLPPIASRLALICGKATKAELGKKIFSTLSGGTNKPTIALSGLAKIP